MLERYSTCEVDGEKESISGIENGYRYNETNRAVLAHHMEVIVAKDVDGILEDFTEDSVLFTLDGKVEGLTASRGFFEPYVAGLTDELLASFQMDRQEVHGELAYIVWNAGSIIRLGTDTIIVQNGKIKYQTSAAYMGS